MIRLQHALATWLPNLLLDELLLDLSLGQSPQKVLFLVLEDLLRQWLALVDRGLHWRLSGRVRQCVSQEQTSAKSVEIWPDLESGITVASAAKRRFPA